ncbi:MAG: hypothetical protein EXS10_09430, partial [Phycisphaerales bacterium]|nr:hypothetical protein [Phycisphaerales bacterium]
TPQYHVSIHEINLTKNLSTKNHLIQSLFLVASLLTFSPKQFQPHVIKRNIQVFSTCDFIAAITQHIPDPRFQMVRYYGWYFNKMSGQRRKRAEEGAVHKSAAIANESAAAAEQRGRGVVRSQARRLESSSADNSSSSGGSTIRFRAMTLL